MIGAKFDPVAGWLDLERAGAALRPVGQIVANHPRRPADQYLRGGGQRARGVETERGTIAAPKVLIAAGGSRAIGRTAGVDPIVAIPRQSFTTGWRHDAFPSNAPMVIGAAPFSSLPSRGVNRHDPAGSIAGTANGSRRRIAPASTNR
ncbi:MAG: hypothetical protein U0521_23935 [Anaerolineae bacterium]